MKTMTTNEAAKMAADLVTGGKHTNSEIGKILAANGYLSMKTGKALGGSGVLMLARKWLTGKTIQDRKTSKYSVIGKRLAQRERARELRESGKRNIAEPDSRQPPPPMLPKKIAVEHASLQDERQARAVMKATIERAIVRLFGFNVEVRLPIDRAFRITHE